MKSSRRSRRRTRSIVTVLQDVSYFEFLERWNFQARNPDNWKKWQSPAKPRVLYFFPRYKPLRAHRQFGDFCRVKLLLNHPHLEHDELLTVNGQDFDNYILAYEYCSGNHEHEDDHYGEADSPDPDADPDEFEAGNFEEEINRQELARLVPDLLPEEEPADLLCRRDIDVNYDWSPHVDRYGHPSFPVGNIGRTSGVSKYVASMWRLCLPKLRKL
jgi:hypothetical protein